MIALAIILEAAVFVALWGYGMDKAFRRWHD